MPVPLLIIPIIMAHYENVINNTEDIVVAISHMVVGLCSVTILPLASTSVCQRRAAMTSSSSAHLALPTERHTQGWGLGGGGRVFLLASRLTEFFMWHPVGLGTKCQPASGTAHQTLLLLGGKRERGGHETRRIICACLLFKRLRNCTDEYMGEPYSMLLLNINEHTQGHEDMADMQSHTRSRPVK